MLIPSLGSGLVCTTYIAPGINLVIAHDLCIIGFVIYCVTSDNYYRILPGKRPPPIFGVPSDLGGYPRKRPPLPFRP